MRKKENRLKTAAFVLSAGVLFGVCPSIVLADEPGEWREENGSLYWYENGIKQGTEGRGKEIYDPASDGWYWLDAIDGGKRRSERMCIRNHGQDLMQTMRTAPGNGCAMIPVGKW